ncbi:MAG: DoxX family membrane protein [Bacteroidales bacterium]
MTLRSFMRGRETVLSNGQQTVLVILRLAIGWHFLYEGIVKLINPNWSAVGYLMDSQGFLSGFFHSMASNPGTMEVVDVLNAWGLTAIGLGLMLGLFTQLATLAGIVLLIFYYLSHPSFIGASYAIPSEGNYLWINKTLIEAIALLVLYYFPTGKNVGLDRFLFKK